MAVATNEAFMQSNIRNTFYFHCQKDLKREAYMLIILVMIHIR